MNFYFFSANPATTSPVTGLALVDFEVDVIRTNKLTHVTAIVVAAAWMTAEVGGGFYVYTVPEPDLYVYDYAVSVRYTGVVPVDTSLWAGIDASTGAPVSTASASLLSVDALASLAEVPVTGLTLADFTVNVYRIVKGSSLAVHSVTGAEVTVEVGAGHYVYYLDGCNFVAYDYLVVIRYTGAEILDCVLWVDKPVGDTPSADVLDVIITGDTCDRLIDLGVFGSLYQFYRSRCTIWTYAMETPGVYGQPAPTWSVLANHANIPCSVAPSKGQEIKGPDMTIAVSSHTISMGQYCGTITPKMRAVISGVTYDILAVEIDSRSRTTRLSAQLVI